MFLPAMQTLLFGCNFSTSFGYDVGYVNKGNSTIVSKMMETKYRRDQISAADPKQKSLCIVKV